MKGVLSIAMLARDRKIPHLLVPAGNAREAAVVEGVAVYPVRTLTEVVEFVNGTRFIDPVRSENQPEHNGIVTSQSGLNAYDAHRG